MSAEVNLSPVIFLPRQMMAISLPWVESGRQRWAPSISNSLIIRICSGKGSSRKSSFLNIRSSLWSQAATPSPSLSFVSLMTFSRRPMDAFILYSEVFCSLRRMETLLTSDISATAVTIESSNLGKSRT